MKNKITIPTTPSFIVCNGTARRVKEYDTEALKLIIGAWGANLINKARKIKSRDKEITI